jgi:hypothetical protein
MPRAPGQDVTTQSNRLGPVTRFAILGVVFGVVSGTIWATLSGFEPVRGAAVGFMGGLSAGAACGLLLRLLKRKPS